mgnify:CR=1 FL=1
METILTILVLYIVAVAFFTIIVKNSPTNKHVPHFNYWTTIFDGMKGMAIGFGIVGVLYFALSQILTWIH